MENELIGMVMIKTKRKEKEKERENTYMEDALKRLE